MSADCNSCFLFNFLFLWQEKAKLWDDSEYISAQLGDVHPSDSFSGLQTALWQHSCPRLGPVSLPSAHPVHAVSAHANTTTPWLSWLIGSLPSTYFTALMKRRAAPEGQLQSCYWPFGVVGFLICSYTVLGCNQPGPYPGKRPCAAVPICYQLDSFQLSSWLQAWETATELLLCPAEGGCPVFFTDFCRRILNKRKSGRNYGMFWGSCGCPRATT